MSPRAYFLTGSGTGVGKTWIGCALARIARARALGVRVYKPVETGCNPFPQDALALKAAAGDPRPLDEICPHAFRAAISPHSAARREGRPIDFEAIVERVPSDGDLVLLESAGGLLTPLTESLLVADLAARTGLPLVIVVPDVLGAINQALLTIEVARGRRLSVAALVLNRISPAKDPAASTHRDAIASFGRVPVLGPCPFVPDELHAAAALEPMLAALL